MILFSRNLKNKFLQTSTFGMVSPKKQSDGIIFLSWTEYQWNVLLRYAWELLYPSIVELFNVNRLYFQQDGAPFHYKECVWNVLYAKFQLRWIGRGGLIPWPSGCPDLTPCDFCVGAYSKFSLFWKIRSLNNLKVKITK